MKWLRTLILFDTANLKSSSDWVQIHESYVRSILSIDHPTGSGSLTLRRKTARPPLPGQNSKKKEFLRNGVSHLRSSFLRHITEAEYWRPESGVDLGRDREQPPILLYPSLEQYREPITSDFGGFDFVTKGPAGLRVAIEWETGNISSSHRSMNKMAIALGKSVIDVGVLIVPSNQLYSHLTDRIGNIGELSGYLAMWESLKFSVAKGLLAITVVEHDFLTDDPAICYLSSGSDGNAKKASP